MNITDKAPELLGTDQNGAPVHVSDYAGRKIALYFYPKDLTSGCTAQACSLAQQYDRLQQAGYEIIGVSVDPPAMHQKFIAKHHLPFRLIADTEHKLVETFEVWAEKSLYGRKYMGTLRTTFIIDGSTGVVEQIIAPKEVKTATHADQLLAL